MQVQKVEIKSKYAKVNEDIHDGDVILIKSEGETVTKTYDGEDVEKMEFDVQLANGKVKKLSPNDRSFNNLVDDYGTDTKNWIDKPVRCEVLMANIRGEMKPVLTLHGGGTYQEQKPDTDTDTDTHKSAF